ncbi:thiocillin family RiPP [Bacillus sp. FSL W7-1360]
MGLNDSTQKLELFAEELPEQHSLGGFQTAASASSAGTFSCPGCVMCAGCFSSVGG